MLHSFMIISGRGGIVLYRKILTKSLNQPRLIAGLVTALCEFSIGSINMPVATIELDKFTISVVEIPVDDLEAGREYLRIVLFHDNHDVCFLTLHHLSSFESTHRPPCQMYALYVGRFLWTCTRLATVNRIQRSIWTTSSHDATCQRTRGRRCFQRVQLSCQACNNRVYSSSHAITYVNPPTTTAALNNMQKLTFL